MMNLDKGDMMIFSAILTIIVLIVNIIGRFLSATENFF